MGRVPRFGARLDTTTKPAVDSLSPTTEKWGGSGRGDFKRARQFDGTSPSPQPSPRSCLAGRGATSAMVGVSRCVPTFPAAMLLVVSGVVPGQTGGVKREA